MRIVLFIGHLARGGAERQLVNLALGLAGEGHAVTVVTFFRAGAEADRLRGVPNVEIRSCMGGRPRRWVPRVVGLACVPLRLRTLLASVRPDVVYSMLEFGNFYAWLATRGGHAQRLVWGYRASNMELNWKRRLPEAACARVSKSVPLLIANSTAGATFAREARGMRPRRLEVVPNGIDTTVFRPSPAAGARLREQIGVAPATFLVGAVGRIDPMKGHAVLLAAARRVGEQWPDCRFVIVGDGPPDRVSRLQNRARELGVDQLLLWVAPMSDMAALYSALDLLVSSSVYGEGWPNVVGEAMACATPCLVTDVGDSASLVAGLGRVVPPGDSGALADAILGFPAWGQGLAAGRLREHIAGHYSVERMCRRTQALLDDVRAQA